MCNINSSNKNFDHRNDTMLHRQDIRQTIKQHGRIEGTWKVHQTSITINGIIFQPSTSIKCKTATLSSFDRTIINNRRRDHPSAHHRCSSPYTIAARPTQLCTVSYGPCTNKYEGDGQPSYIMHPQEIII